MALSENTQRAHAAEAFWPGTAQQFEQNGFGLVVAVVRKRQGFATRQVLGEYRAPCLACRVFESRTCSARDIDGNHIERHPQARREVTAMLRPLRAVGVQIVIDVNRAQAAIAYAWDLYECMQQHGRIHAAAVADSEATGRQTLQGFVQAPLEFTDGHVRRDAMSLGRARVTPP